MKNSLFLDKVNSTWERLERWVNRISVLIKLGQMLNTLIGILTKLIG